MVDDTLVETGNWDILVDEFPLATPRALMRILDEEEERGQKRRRGPSTSGEPPTKRGGPQGPPPPPSGGGQGITV